MHRPLYLHSSSGRPLLRVGVLLDSCVRPAWVAEIFEDIRRSNFARLELAIINAEPAERPQGLMSVLADKKSRRNLLFRIYARSDRKHLGDAEGPFRAVDCTSVLQDVESISVLPLRKGFVHRFAEEDLERVRAKNLDVLIRFGFNILRGDILKAARFGVWSYHHGDNDSYRGGPPYFWELVEGNPISGAMLQILTEDLDAGKVLCKGFFATRPGASWARNKVQPYWGASGFMMQKLYQLHEQGWESVQAQVVCPVPYRGQTKVYKAPTNGQMLRWTWSLFTRAASRWALDPLRHLKMTHWKLAVRCAEPADDVEQKLDLSKFRWLRSPRGHFYADPFLFPHEGRRWLFFEDFDYGARRATLACAEVLASGALSQPIGVLERPYHLSYPCIFRVGEEVFMIPETREHGTVELYRCKRFPNHWELAGVLLHAPAVDTTVWCEAGLFWFFVTLREPRGGGLQLWLFSSTAIDGEWVSHPANPISTDIRNSRGGGAIYRQGEKLFRPSQDCSGNYGRSFALNEILVLNRDEYRERVVRTVDAPKGMTGTHTYARLDGLEVVDGCAQLPFWRVLDWRSFRARLRQKARFALIARSA